MNEKAAYRYAGIAAVLKETPRSSDAARLHGTKESRLVQRITAREQHLNIMQVSLQRLLILIRACAFLRLLAAARLQLLLLLRAAGANEELETQLVLLARRQLQQSVDHVEILVVRGVVQRAVAVGIGDRQRVREHRERTHELHLCRELHCRQQRRQAKRVAEREPL